MITEQEITNKLIEAGFNHNQIYLINGEAYDNCHANGMDEVNNKFNDLANLFISVFHLSQ